MGRVVKDADVRRKEIIDTALALFAAEGYERVSVEQITEAVGVAKGTFYHYFKTKQELLAEAATSWGDALFERLENELAGMQEDALTRLRSAFLLSASWKLESRDTAIGFGTSLYSDENVRLVDALMKGWTRRMGEMFTPILEQGAAEGVFHIADPEASADVFAALWMGWADLHAVEMIRALTEPELIPELSRGLRAIEAAMERIIGVDEGALGLHLDRSMEAMRAGAGAPSAGTDGQDASDRRSS